MPRKLIDGKVTLEYTCNICRRKVTFQLRLVGPDIYKREAEGALGSDYFVWEGQCPECYNWNEVKL